MNSVVVSHPHAAAVAVGTACALDREGMLAALLTGAGAARYSWRGSLLQRLSTRWPRLANRVWTLDARRIQTLGSVEIGARLVSKAARRLGRRTPSQYDALFVGHDAAAALMPWPRGVTAVYAYEDGALRTFRKAARRNVARILDQPSPFWRTVEKVWLEESRRWPGAMGSAPPLEPEWKKRRKDEELALADAVSVASAFTRASLVEAGYRGSVILTPYGYPVELFSYRTKTPDGPFTVISVGTQDLRKGTPYLLEAWRKAGLRDARLRLIGPMRLTEEFLKPYRQLFEQVAPLPKVQLEREYQAADLLAFPTLGDGFGLVIQEAMCCGTPALTTRCGGGPECITSGTDGLIVPEANVEVLVEALRWAAANRDRLWEMGRAARRRAEAWMWDDAGLDLTRRLSAVLRTRA